ncbi:hypothetical protein B0T26DRAFT_405988 [Lasiosphaeria miniovina]|uniref:Uncharacterized protein n=1 Tax=Lasiosphaeria miniovina TaxID=1954250 RepID=A0AA40A547_9PEZI|nr:uncharacterized protein B0T26DRAFT_405988 [Lasiosphaeria miniovina]KAK0709442.1 hypothetical protein B0T26DRAFT_405988 [Lasiosphaeria miniovina]
MPKAMAARRINRMMTMTAMTSFSFILADLLCDAQEEMCGRIGARMEYILCACVGFTFLLSRASDQTKRKYVEDVLGRWLCAFLEMNAAGLVVRQQDLVCAMIGVVRALSLKQREEGKKDLRISSVGGGVAGLLEAD